MCPFEEIMLSKQMKKNNWKKDYASSIFGESFNSMASMLLEYYNQINTAYE